LVEFVGQTPLPGIRQPYFSLWAHDDGSIEVRGLAILTDQPKLADHVRRQKPGFQQTLDKRAINKP
jgi:hypothetical protein